MATVAAITDLRFRRIPNWLTVSSLLAGLVLNTIVGHWQGLKMSLLGAGLCLAILLPLVLVRGLGAGDWKLMGALGAILGPTVLIVLLITALISGAMALIQIVIRQRIRDTLFNLWQILKSFACLGLRGIPPITLDTPGARSIPFGVAAALGTVACFVTLLVRIHAGF